MWRSKGDTIRSEKRSTYYNDHGKRNSTRAFKSGLHPDRNQTFYRRVSQDSTQSSFRTSLKRRYSSRASTPPSYYHDDDPIPNPPTTSILPNITGYQCATFISVAVPPPKSKQTSEQEDCCPIRTTHPSPPEIDEKDARKALLGHVSNRYCYGKSAAKHMIITKMNHSSTFHYSLETFTETRQVAWTFEPYLGGHLDTSVGGIPPDPWSVSVDSPQAFETRTIHLPVPHTDCIRTCHVCGGVGRRRCYTCNGTGWETCYSCTGDGYKPHQFVQGDKERCLHCYGNGRRKCWKCNSDGMITCKVCSGTGQIRCYLKLTVNWTNHIDDFIMDQDEIPKERLKCAFGKIILDETGEQLQALSHFPHSTVTRASSNILKKHRDTYLQTEKLVVQRQRIYLIPITRVSYSWRGKSKFFWVYGTERTIHAPDYPQKFCCDCSIS